jgi:hypothetical protein
MSKVVLKTFAFFCSYAKNPNGERIFVEVKSPVTIIIIEGDNIYLKKLQTTNLYQLGKNDATKMLYQRNFWTNSSKKKNFQRLVLQH